VQDTAGLQKTKVAAAFGQVAASFDQGATGRFTYYGRRLVTATNLAPGARVLDIAAGRGAVLFPAAQQVGPTGSVLGVDLSAPMVEATATEIQRRDVSNARIEVMDAEQLKAPSGGYDAVLCGFGLMFFPHLELALAEFRRVLRPGGVLAVSTWGAPDPRWEWVQPLLRSYGASAADALTVTRLNQPSDVAAVLRQAGWTAVETRLEETEDWYADEKAWWDELWSSVQRLPLEQLPPAALAECRAAAHARLATLRTNGGLPRRWQAVFGLAINPARSAPGGV